MVTLYDLANTILQDLMTVYYDDDNAQFDDIIRFLNGESDKYNSIFNSYDSLKTINHNSVKRVIMLIIFSYAYLVNLYNVRIDLDSENSQKYLDYLESIDAKEIIDMFACHSPEIKTFYEDCSNYLTNTYIYRYCCWANAFAERKQDVILKLNPFALLEYQDIDLGDGFVETEVCIQLFDDLYNKAVEEAAADPELVDNDEEIFSRLVIDYFREAVDNHFNGNTFQINQFYSLIFSNIYENITLNSTQKRQRKKYKTLIKKMEEYSISDLISLFMESYQLAIDVIDIFIMYNNNLEKEELINRRIKFLKKGNQQKLAEINPFYERDNEVLKRHKKNSSNS